ncbi:MAG: hypothetical protein ACI90V_007795 [Bacillariaceae sp.]
MRSGLVVFVFVFVYSDYYLRAHSNYYLRRRHSFCDL